ncbi:type II secretion system protein E [Rhodopirellula maiorica SM1]|uniref:Type II secretion system protein E n=1 Tax=Rhodopirellula maiorica SM1 TaxID=1265738 RepID=M5RPK4_9BACT|nr:ATPase, T2SS/T4P/T4SS family [Rhodopirellula maiorica]EMI21151.1 type II secretion system protein E [Rhodopirellula maiorica SM1]
MSVSINAVVPVELMDDGLVEDTALPVPATDLPATDIPSVNTPATGLSVPATDMEGQRRDVTTELAQQYAKYYALPFFDPPEDAPLPIDPGIAERLPSQWCFRNQVAPLSDDGKIVEVAVVEPDGLLLADEIRRLTGRQMQPLFATATVMDRLIETLYGDELSTMDAAKRSASESVNEPALQPPTLPMSISPEESGKAMVSKNPLPHILRPLVQELVTQIVIEPHQHAFRVRARGPKGMYVLQSLSRVEGNEILAQVASRMNLRDGDRASLQSTSASGEFRVRLGAKRVSIFASFCPATSGTMLNLTRTISQSVPVDIDQLGFQRSQLEAVQSVLRKRSGLIVLAGPRKCGKTTTMYSLLAELNDPSLLICSLEDSMSVPCEGINQLSLCKHAGLDKKSAMDSLARQSPDVIAIDKIDNADVARAAMHEAAMGRLVIATIESADPAMTPVRLKQLGLEEQELNQVLSAVISHHKLNRLCRKCSQSHRIGGEDAERLGLDSDTMVSRASGCPSCRDTGYDGNLVAFEVRHSESASETRIVDVVASHILAGTIAADSLKECR